MARKFHLVCYDITDEKRLRRVAKIMEGWGVRVQKSVFECYLEEEEVLRLKSRLRVVMNLKEDEVRFYRLPTGKVEVEILGKGKYSGGWHESEVF